MQKSVWGAMMCRNRNLMKEFPMDDIDLSAAPALNR
jgi:hypothetical protein